MVIVAGHITVEPQQRESYLAGCVSIVERARGAAGCLDFAITADLIDPGRVAVGLMAPLAVAASWPALRRLDAGMRVRDADIAMLRGVRMLGALPAATIEQLAAGLEHAEFAPREAVFEQSEHGDRFYVVESGRAEVIRDGRLIETLAEGTASARSPSCATSRGRRPSAPPRIRPCW